ncbi:MAG: glycosyltransferase [Gammaproteobacteria bacterium]|nr:glycosyltransferase [Gammaproteobacteria bacterium]
MTLDSQPMTTARQPGIESMRMAITSDAAPERNGVGAYYQDLISYLEPRLARVVMYSPTIGEDGAWNAGLVLPMPGDSTQRVCVPNIYKLRRDLAELDPHVVIVPTPGVYGVAGAFLASRRGIPVLTGFHTSFEQLAELYWHGSLTGRVFRQYIDKIHRYLIRVSAAVLVNSSEMEAEARALGARNIVRIGTPLPHAFATHPIAPYGGGFSKILFAGRLAAEKNLAAIIESAEAMPALQFSIAGDGPLREEVESAAARLPNFTYLDWLDREALRDQIDAHDALILPSHFETFGTIALEAMSRNRVVIVSKASGIVDWKELTQGFEVIDERGLLAALRDVLGLSPESRKELAQRAYNAAQTFNDENLRGWEGLLVDTANAGNRFHS